MSLSNRQISKLFRFGAQLLELHDENPFKAKAYDIAASRIKTMGISLWDLPQEDLPKQDGIGKAIAAKIVEIRNTGSYEELDQLLQLTPPGVIEMSKIRGIGAKKVRALWKDLGITSPEELVKACEENKVQALKGFGKKTQAHVIELVHFYFASRHKFMYSEAEFEARQILEALEKNPAITRVSLTAAMRRKMEIISRIEFVVEMKEGNKLDTVIDAEASYLEKTESGFVSAEMSIPVDFYVVKAGDWIKTLFETTGNEEHLKMLKAETFSSNSEEEIYSSNGFPYIIPEMREGLDEFRIMQQRKESDIISMEDLRGCLHNHSNWSDGSRTIEEMAMACQERGYEYFGLSDHSKSGGYAGGLQPDKVMRQWKEVDELNKKFQTESEKISASSAPLRETFKIFKGIESDILKSGQLDYEEDILKGFDFVVASVHSQLQMNEQEATQRLITAVENPYTTILGHISARLLLSRPGFPLSHEKVIDACAANGVVIEINANPRRLELDWRWLNYALHKGVMLSINPDAHDIDEIPFMYYGVCVARKAGVPKERILNTFSLSQLEEFFAKKRL